MKTDYIHEQGAGSHNEDAISINGSMFGVFDGATSLTAKKFSNGKTGGAIASNTARKIFAKNNDSLQNLALKANTAIYEKMVENKVDTADKASLWSTSAAVVKFDKKTLEWIQIGDSLLLLIYKDGSYKIPVTDFDHDSETLTLWKEMANKTDKPVLQAMSGQIKKVRKAMNVDYGVLNGEETVSAFIKSGKEDLKDISHVLLFTDGLFIPSETPDTGKDFDQFVELFHKGGLPEIRNYVRNIEKSDPDCRVYPRFKRHDDIAAIALEIPEPDGNNTSVCCGYTV